MTREELIDQLAFLRGWYGSINERERSGRFGEILLLLDSIVDGHDIRMTLLDTPTTHRCRDRHR